MKRNHSFSSAVLIRIKPQPARFSARRGVALLRAWRQRFEKLEADRLAQAEFEFAALRRPL